MDKRWPQTIAYSILGVTLGYQGLKFLGRRIFRDVATDSLRTIMTDKYGENLWEFVSAITKVSPQVVVETSLRSQEGELIHRPLGSPKKLPSLNQIMFNIGQFHIMPTPLKQHIDTKVVIGRACQKPLVIDLPIMISGMAYGSLSEKAKVALAKGAGMAGTATNTGEGPFLKSERKAAKHLILQYNRGTWNKTPEILRQADAVEIQFGQGAYGGVGYKVQSQQIDNNLRKAYGLAPGQDLVVQSRQPEVNHPSQLPKLVRKIKAAAGDIPVGVKFGAGKYLEDDIAWAVKGGINFVVIDGGEAGDKGSPPILQDDFGVPTVFAISRAAGYLRKHNLQKKVALIAAGNIRTPGDMLKVLALGADAVYIGATALFAVSHTQVLKALPFEPPTQILWYNGKYADKFDVAAGSKSLAKFLQSCKEELISGVRALGKTAIGQVSKDDLFALDELIAKGVGIPMAYEPSGTIHRASIKSP